MTVFLNIFIFLYITKTGSDRSLGEATLAGISLHLPHIKDQLFGSRLSLRGWRRLVPSVQYPPLTWDITVCIGVQLACNGHWSMGVGILLAFDCYLRVGELLNLRWSDVALPQDRRLGPTFSNGTLRLRKTKTGPEKSVAIKNVDIIFLLRLLLSRSSRDEDARLFDFSPPTLRSQFKRACTILEIPDIYVLHFLRHGGATHDHLRGMSLPDILRHGRWAETKSARHYIQAGRALLLSAEIPESVYELSRSLVPNIRHAFSLSQEH